MYRPISAEEFSAGMQEAVQASNDAKFQHQQKDAGRRIIQLFSDYAYPKPMGTALEEAPDDLLTLAADALEGNFIPIIERQAPRNRTGVKRMAYAIVSAAHERQEQANNN